MKTTILTSAQKTCGDYKREQVIVLNFTDKEYQQYLIDGLYQNHNVVSVTTRTYLPIDYFPN